jgi:prevent-host-death family protein
MTSMLTVGEVKTQFVKLIQRVQKGEEIIIAQNGKPIARLSPIAQVSKKRRPGSAAGRIVIAADFDAPLPEAILETFER